MKSKKLLPLILLLTGVFILLAALQPMKSKGSGGTKVLIETTYGRIVVKLYDETPLHRDNFIKLIKEHYFDSLLFHRVIRNFMIQGGDPDSRHASPEKQLGDGGPPYTIPAEINPLLFHKKGVLAAARESDLDNPSRASSGSQFYIVQGKVFNDSMLTLAAKRITRMQVFNRVINLPENKSLLEAYQRISKAGNEDSMKVLTARFNAMTDTLLLTEKPYVFSEAQRKAYTTTGGTPHLDGSYTVFGEVTEGLNVVDSIAAVKTGENDRPLKDVRIIRISIIH